MTDNQTTPKDHGAVSAKAADNSAKGAEWHLVTKLNRLLAESSTDMIFRPLRGQIWLDAINVPHDVGRPWDLEIRLQQAGWECRSLGHVDSECFDHPRWCRYKWQASPACKHWPFGCNVLARKYDPQEGRSERYNCDLFLKHNESLNQFFFCFYPELDRLIKQKSIWRHAHNRDTCRNRDGNTFGTNRDFYPIPWDAMEWAARKGRDSALETMMESGHRLWAAPDPEPFADVARAILVFALRQWRRGVDKAPLATWPDRHGPPSHVAPAAVKLLETHETPPRRPCLRSALAVYRFAPTL
jgi:hypothetical protein